MTSPEQTETIDAAPDPTDAFPTVHGSVVRSAALTPNLWQVTVGGFPGAAHVRGDEFVYVLVSAADDGIRRDYAMRDHMRQDSADPVRGAYYTVRRVRPDGDIDLWVVDHGSAGSVGEWLVSARAGDPLALWGPRRGFEVPPDARQLLLVADETGFAAVAALIETVPPSCGVTAVLETVDPSHRPTLPWHPQLSTVWVDRGVDTAQVRNRLLAAVRSLHVRPDAAFGAGESRQISEVRRHVRTHFGVLAERVLMTGYWRRERES